MRYLLDTHVLLWAANTDKHRLISSNVGNIMRNISNELFLSKISLWEISIKFSLGKLPNLQNGTDELFRYAADTGIRCVNIEQRHLKTLESLPFIHRDPFDRLLVATALAENMTLLTSDENIHQYDARWAW
jgi:PIN domain nuclease of toxin-antitoxin system